MVKKRILILGGVGFIGTNLIKYYLNKDYEIHATHHNTSPRFTNSKIVYYNTDLTKENEVIELFRSIKPHIVLHAAAVTTGSKDVLEQPYLHVTDNAIMNSLIFRECYLQKIEHCIFLSCTVMYQSKDFAQKESDWNANDPIYPNYLGVGSMKVFSEKMCDFYSRLGDTKFTAIRHSNVFGPHDKFDLNRCHLVPAMIRKVAEDEKIQVNGGKENEPRRDIIYIDDLCSFIDLCIKKQKEKYELINCGYGQAFSVTDIIKLIQEINKCNKEIVYNVSKPNIPTTVVLDCNKANSLLGWIPKTKIKDGLKKTLDWFEKNVR